MNTSPRAHGAEALERFLPRGIPVADVEKVIRKVLEEHGPSAFEMPREAALAHEAGHAIVGTHEGFSIRSLTISSQSGLWGGWCVPAGAPTWTSGPDTTAQNDLRRARMVIAGLAGESLTTSRKPGSSLDELVTSQHIAFNAARKLANPDLSIPEFDAYARQLWREQVFGFARAIVRKNREVFFQIIEQLHRHESVKGRTLRNILALVKRIDHE
jgi:hypothetical protein